MSSVSRPRLARGRTWKRWRSTFRWSTAEKRNSCCTGGHSSSRSRWKCRKDLPAEAGSHERVLNLPAEAGSHERVLKRLLAQEHPVRGVVRFSLIPVPEAVEKRFEIAALGRRHLEGREDPTEVCAVVAIVEQTDVPAAPQLIQ